MTRNDDFIGHLEGYLEEYEGSTPLPDDVRDAIRAQLPLTQQRRFTWWPARRFPEMNKALTLGVAATAVVIVAIIGINLLRAPSVGSPGLGDTSPTVVPSPSSSAVGFPADGEMEPGTYVISEPFPVEITMRLAEPWSPWTPGVGVDAAAIFQGSPDPPDGRVIVFVIVENLWADPCDPRAELLDPPLGPTVADLAAALAGQPHTEATEPVEVTISGYSGVYLDYTNTGGCGTLDRWPSTFGTREALAGERDQVWILDVDGVRLVIDAASFQGTDESDLAEMRTLIESLTIEP